MFGYRNPVSAVGRVFQDDHVPRRQVTAVVATVKITTERWRRGIVSVTLRAAGQQEWCNLFVEQYFVVKLLIILDKGPHLGHRMFELEHESIALVMAVAISDSNSTVQYRRRELILFGVLAV